MRHSLIPDTQRRTVIHHGRGTDGGIAARILGEGPPIPDPPIPAPPGLALDVAALFPPAA